MRRAFCGLILVALAALIIAAQGPKDEKARAETEAALAHPPAIGEALSDKYYEAVKWEA
jgi:hypothetical protein